MGIGTRSRYWLENGIVAAGMTVMVVVILAEFTASVIRKLAGRRRMT